MIADAAAARRACRSRAGERARQRLDAEVREQRMRGGVAGGPQHGAEAARVAQPQRQVAEHRDRSGRASPGGSPARTHAQAARHAEMQDQVAGAAVEQQVLAAPARPRARCARRASRRGRAGTRQRRRGSRTVDRGDACGPTTCGAMPRRVISTSGSSGIEVVALAAVLHYSARRRRFLVRRGNIPKLRLSIGSAGHPMTPFRSCSRFTARCAPRACRARGAARGLAQAASRRDRQAPADEAVAQKPSADERRARPADEPALPQQELTGDTLYEFLLGGDRRPARQPGLAAQAYADLAKRTRDPRVARARDRDRALRAHAAKPRSRRRRSGPKRTPTRRTRSARRRAAGQREPGGRGRALPGEAARDATAERGGDGFMQLSRLLASNPDKAAQPARGAAAWREPYPDLPQAHFAVAQAAAAPGSDELALEGDPRGRAAAARLGARGDLRGAAAAAQVARAPRASASRSFLEKLPEVARRAAHLCARCWSPSRSYAEARVEFEKLLAGVSRQHRRDLRGRPAGGAAQGLRRRRSQPEAPARPRLPRPERRALHARPDRRGAEGLAGRAATGTGASSAASSTCRAQMRYAQVLAKQGKLDEARAVPAAGRARATTSSACSCCSPRRSCCARPTRTRRPSTLLEQALEALPEQPELLYDHAMIAEKLDRFDVLESQPAQADPAQARPRARLQRARLLARRPQPAPAGSAGADRAGARSSRPRTTSSSTAWAGCCTAWAT